MPWISKFIIFMLSVIVVGLLILFLLPPDFDWSKDSFISLKKPLGQSSYMPVEVLAIDSTNVKDGALDRLRSGDAVILLGVVKTSNDPSVPVNTYFFDSASALAKLTPENSGYLDSSMPVFNNLAVARFDVKHKILYYTPLTQAGIASITVDKSYLAAEAQADPQRYNLAAGKAVFSDSSGRVLHIVLIPTQNWQGVEIRAALLR